MNERLAFISHTAALIPWNDDPQRAREHAVVERGGQDDDLAVRGDVQALGPVRLDPDLLGAQRVEVFRRAQAAEERAHGEAEQAQPARAVRDVEAQAAGVEAGAPADGEVLRQVLVVADEDEVRAAHDLPPVGVQAHVEERVAAQDGERRPEEGRPLAAPQALPQLLPAAYDARVEAEARIVDEDPAVHLAHVHRTDAPLADAARGLLDGERDAEVFREVVERAERQDAERLPRPREQRGHRAHRPVAAARDDGARAVRERATREAGDLLAPARQADAGLDAARAERAGDGPYDLGRFVRARRRVDDHLDD